MIQLYKDKLNKLKGKFETLQEQKENLDLQLVKLSKRTIALEEAQTFIQMVAKDTQEQLKFNIIDLVQLALDTCFPDIYTFDIDFKIKYGRTEAQLLFFKNGIEIDPMTGSGGGFIDLAAFALRISAWSLGHTDNVLILDEPLKWLQPKELQMRGFEIIKRLSKKLNLQFIISSNSVNNDEIISIADKIFEVSQNKATGISKVVERSSE